MRHQKYLEEINSIFNNMWKESMPTKYLNFRTFIMGIKGNDEIFPNGVVYQGVNNDEPLFLRGETGAQDSIIPSVDSAFDINYPQNSLTEYLFDLRSYRPYHHQEYIKFLK